MIAGFSFFELAIYYLIAVNFVAFAAFGIDKSLAESGRYRISEAALLLWAFIGGTPGAYAGRQLFRHKTRKQPFSNELHGVAIFQLLVILVFMVFGPQAIFEFLKAVAS